MARELHYQGWERSWTMEAFVITFTLVGTCAGAFFLQKAALKGLFRVMNTERRTRE